MKKTIYISLILLIIYPFYLRGQEDTLAIVKVYDSYLVEPGIMEFDLRIERLSESWTRFANGTFQLEFIEENFPINTNSIRTTLLDSELYLTAFSGGDLPTDGYIIDPKIFDGRISITVTGPNEYTDAAEIPVGGTLLLGRFMIESLNGDPLPDELKWKYPITYYQASAYKRETDSLREDFIVWYDADDNVEMVTRGGSRVAFRNDDAPDPGFELIDFTATYVGSKQIELEWNTRREAFNYGFILRRAVRPNTFIDPADLDYRDTVATYFQGDYHDPGLAGAFTTEIPQNYLFQFDTASIRGLNYCYQLSYIDFNNNENILAYACAPVPNAVISFAQSRPNPFSSSTSINYILDDEVFLTVSVYDYLGREVKKLTTEGGEVLDHLRMPKGNFVTEFVAPELAVQGLYDVVFIAYPIDDPSIEISRAVVKIQLIR
ncbi:MAG: T9SS type A sorting domain-containing protein [Candidatus Kapaibacterium sp.]